MRSAKPFENPAGVYICATHFSGRAFPTGKRLGHLDSDRTPYRVRRPINLTALAVRGIA